jgi:uncharacterized protein YjbI with pentapeptide repeats
MKISQEELNDILDKHKKYMNNLPEGERADLSNMDLSNANLSYANLIDANLSNAKLSNANLSYANLSNANLSNANLHYSILSNANLSYANLSNANLSNANLHYSILSNANLSNVDLSNANLHYSILSNVDLSNAYLNNAYLNNAYLNNTNLSNTDLSKANLSEIKEDLFRVLENAKPEVLGLYKALIEGRIDGTIYEGECACLIGTIANIRNVDVSTLKRNPLNPIERWFFSINKGDIPKTNQISNITKIWIEEFAKLNDIKLD